MSFEFGLAIFLALFPFGWQMMSMPNSQVVGIASWAICIVIMSHLTSKSQWFTRYAENHTRRSIAVLSSLTTLLICILVGAGMYRSVGSTTKSTYLVNFDTKYQEKVSSKNYFNEVVELDNKIFENCNFTNVKFMYHGIGPWGFVNSHFMGDKIVETDNAGAKSFIELTQLIGSASAPGTRVEVFGIDSNGNRRPLLNGPPSPEPQNKK